VEGGPCRTLAGFLQCPGQPGEMCCGAAVRPVRPLVCNRAGHEGVPVENTEFRAVVRASTTGGLPVVPPLDAVVPRQLPAAIGDFSGRTDELAELESLVGSRAVVISAMNGTAGVGKTALAMHWAHRVADQFPDGQLYVNMRGFEPDREPMSVAEAVRGFLDAFGVPSDAIPASLDAQTALFRSAVAGRRVLILLDNVNNVDQVRPLLPGSPTCFVLVTSRNRLSGLVAEHGARPLRLDRLSDGEATTLLRSRLGDVDPGVLAEIAELCAGLPLALAIVAARIALEPHLPISEVVAELRADRLEALDLGEGERGARAVFSWSVRSLRDPAARLFRLLGLHPGPDIDTHAAAALTGLPMAVCKKLLRELVSASLLGEYLPGRFRFHDLLRLFARELAGVDGAAQHRMLGFYLHTAWAGDRALVSYRIAMDLPPLDPDVVPLTFVSPAGANEWFTAEHTVLMGLVDHAVSAGFDAHAWQLALAMRSYLDKQGHWRDRVSVYRTAIGPVNRIGDPFAQARVHRGLGRALYRLSEMGEAESMLRLAWGFAIKAGDPEQQAHCQEALSTFCARRGRHDLALAHAEMCMALHPVHDDKDPWLAASYVMKGRCLVALNLFDEARAATSKALELYRDLEPRDESGEAEAHNSASHILAHQGEFALSLESALTALALHRQLGNQPGTVEALSHIGDACRQLGRHDDASHARDEAMMILADLQGFADAEMRFDGHW
jgi:tetratricopeptide (TPR) repeat protein